MQSHLEWVRGLKQRERDSERERFRVAPRVGAWIETEIQREKIQREIVAPRVGAWIETEREIQRDSERESRTSSGCVD